MLEGEKNGVIERERILAMKTKLRVLLLIPSLAILSGGCTTALGPASQDFGWAANPAFSQDSAPDAPNYYWMTDGPSTPVSSAAVTLGQPQGGKEPVLSPGDVNIEPDTAR